MDYKQYLIDQKDLQLSAIANRMWKNNKNAKVYLSMKLKGDRPWTEKDNITAHAALVELGKVLIELPAPRNKQ
jgi:hypothetical protein